MELLYTISSIFIYLHLTHKDWWWRHWWQYDILRIVVVAQIVEQILLVGFGLTVCLSINWFKTSFFINKQLDQTQPIKFVSQFMPLPQFSEYHTTTNASTTSLSGSNGNICSSSLCNISLKNKSNDRSSEKVGL